MQRRGPIRGIGKSFTKKKKSRKSRKKRKREDRCIVADEQPSTLGELDFRKVLGYRSP
jgi:hypothetical protein